jgi:hypothetical protein
MKEERGAGPSRQDNDPQQYHKIIKKSIGET